MYIGHLGPLLTLYQPIPWVTLNFNFQEEQRKLAKQYREELREAMEEHEEVHSEIRWRRVCVIFDDVSQGE